MNRDRLIRVGILLVAAFAGARALAEDQRVMLPGDWDIGSEGVAIGADRVAYSGTQLDTTEGENPVVRSRIFQKIGGTTVTTDFEGKCTARRYSPDGKTLLAVQLDPAAGRCCNCPVRVVLIDAQGKVISDFPYGHRAADFSTTGEALYLGPSCGGLDCLGNRIDIYGLDGRLLRTAEPGLFESVTVIGRGSETILQDQHGVWRLGATGSTTWARSLEPQEYPYGSTTYVPPDKVLVRLTADRFDVIDFGGVVVFRYPADSRDAQTSANQAAKTWIRDVRPGLPDQLWLTRDDGDYVVDLKVGTTRSIQVDRTPPSDFFLARASMPRPSEVSGHLVFVGKQELLIRSVSFEPAAGH